MLSDPDLSYIPSSDVLRLCSREVEGPGQTGVGAERVYCQDSPDLVMWSAPVTVARFTPAAWSHVSPTFLWGADDSWRMWYVHGRCSDTTSVVESVTSADTTPVATDLRQPGYVIWHLQVRAFAGAYWALYNAYRPDPSLWGCGYGDLFLARSTDGIHWSVFPRPVLAHLASSLFPAGYYRSSMVYDTATDVLGLWVSGYWLFSSSLDDGQGAIRYHFAQLLAALGTPAATEEAERR